jgi:hypothetical protein
VSEDAAIEAYDALVQWLRDSKLEWVAEQIEEEAILGKTEPERIAIADADEFSVLTRAGLKSPSPNDKVRNFSSELIISPSRSSISPSQRSAQS